MTEPQFRKKFIAYVDILGFKAKVESAERGEGLSLSELLDAVAVLENRIHSETIRKDGPTICRGSRHIQHDVDYRVTQISDCVVVSAEVSPSGIIHIIGHIQGSAWKLLMQGMMVRGYVTCGNIFHEGNKIIGTGYQNALDWESSVAAFRDSTDDGGTPFVEIDPEVVRYINECGDPCVQKKFARMARNKHDIAAVFPFQKFSNLMDFSDDDLDKIKQNLEKIRSWIDSARMAVESLAPSSDPKATPKSKYYLEFLDDELAVCAQLKQEIDSLQEP